VPVSKASKASKVQVKQAAPIQEHAKQVKQAAPI
jgi:hypothetical protein